MKNVKRQKRTRKLRIISFVILFFGSDRVFLRRIFWMLSNSFKSTKRDFAGAYEYAAEAVYA